MQTARDGRFAGKVVLVTGGNSGLGLETAKHFAAEGAKVIITGRREEQLASAAKQIGPAATAIRADSADLDSLDRLFSHIQTEKGRLDVVFANAGTGGFQPLGAITEEHFDKIFDVNVKGTLFTVQKALPMMVDGGSIVINSSNAAHIALPAFSVYSATKAALRAFARNWAVDLKPRKIRVNVISPGIVITPGYKNELELNDEQIEQMKKQAAVDVPAGRVGTPDEIARAVLFLASADSSYVNGTELVVDGGASEI